MAHFMIPFMYMVASQTAWKTVKILPSQHTVTGHYRPFEWRFAGEPMVVRFFMFIGLFVSKLFQNVVLHCLPSVLSSLGLNALACINALMRLVESEILKTSLSLVY